MNYKIENGISGPIIIFNDGLKQETYFDIPNNILNVIKELGQDNRQLELKLQQKEDTINKAKEHLQLKIIRYSNEINYILNSTDLKEIIEILDNKGE